MPDSKPITWEELANMVESLARGFRKGGVPLDILDEAVSRIKATRNATAEVSQ
jgi:hypothetical protein